MCRLFTFSSETRSILRLVQRLLLYGAPLLATVGALEAVLWITGESWSVTKVLDDLQQHRQAMFRRVVLSQQYKLSRGLMIIRRKPSIVALGSSRAMRFRDVMFPGYEDEFVTAGGMIQGPADLVAFATLLEDKVLPTPQVMLVSLDPWWLQETGKPDESQLLHFPPDDAAWMFGGHVEAWRSLLRYGGTMLTQKVGARLHRQDRSAAATTPRASHSAPTTTGGTGEAAADDNPLGKLERRSTGQLVMVTLRHLRRFDFSFRDVLISPFEHRRAIGLAPILVGSGFRYDGSHVNESTVAEHLRDPRYRDRTDRPHVGRVLQRQRPFQYAGFDWQVARTIRDTLRRFEQVGIEVHCFALPIANPLRDQIVQDEELLYWWHTFWNEYLPWMQQEGFPCMAAETPQAIGCSDEYMTDSVHPSDTLVSMLVEEMLRRLEPESKLGAISPEAIAQLRSRPGVLPVSLGR